MCRRKIPRWARCSRRGTIRSATTAREEIDLSEYEPGSTIVYDWKGDPMVIQPGDKLPNVM